LENLGKGPDAQIKAMIVDQLNPHILYFHESVIEQFFNINEFNA
jgi:hypothetical protein